MNFNRDNHYLWMQSLFDQIRNKGSFLCIFQPIIYIFFCMDISDCQKEVSDSYQACMNTLPFPSKHFLNPFLLILSHKPILHSHGMPSSGYQIFFYLWSLGLVLAITIIPRNSSSLISKSSYHISCSVTKQSGTYCRE